MRGVHRSRVRRFSFFENRAVRDQHVAGAHVAPFG